MSGDIGARIAALRAEIGVSTVRLIEEVARRALIARQIIDLKRAAGLPVRDAAREKELRRAYCDSPPYPLTPAVAIRLLDAAIEAGIDCASSQERR